MIKQIQSHLKTLSSKEKQAVLQRFFKTGKGEYGQGDIFIGVTVPQIRKVSRQYQDASLDDTIQLLKSPIHEERLAALLILIFQFTKAGHYGKKKIYDLYLKHTKYINNWDLVDLSAHHIVGAFLEGKDKNILQKLASSKLLWDRRIAIIATFYFIRRNQYHDTLMIAKQLLNDKEDLMHKALGWMLREIGKRDLVTEEKFLKDHYRKMPRTMLRYAIERFPEEKRQAYLQGTINSCVKP
ncbi:MAG: DNA alkylation repair protein [Candidatus Omnitrophota bacterium]|jgi:3-methyladenine DNA glycosylase AlkD